MTSCDVCHGGINFAGKPAARCLDCNQHVHTSCQKRLALPCLPRQVTPRTPAKQRTVSYHLNQFCPSSAPMIPHVIIYCVVALERNRLSFEGIYRVPGKKNQVEKVLEELKTSRAVPKLELQDTEVITDCIKSFLRHLKDPLIPKSSREEFLRATSTDNASLLNQAICDLPQPNRDTLAYLIMHWHKVSEMSAKNMMPLENIARVVAPTVVGCAAALSRADLDSALSDTRRQEAVMMALLKLGTEYWQRFLVDLPVPGGEGRRTQHDRAERVTSPCAVDRSMLGPVSCTPTAPAPLLRPVTTQRRFVDRRFFDSPM